MRSAVLVGIIIMVLITLVAGWYEYQELQNPSITQQKQLTAMGCTPSSYDSQGSPTAWSCPGD
jgi:hypothetical protein